MTDKIYILNYNDDYWSKTFETLNDVIAYAQENAKDWDQPEITIYELKLVGWMERPEELAFIPA